MKSVTKRYEILAMAVALLLTASCGGTYMAAGTSNYQNRNVVDNTQTPPGLVRFPDFFQGPPIASIGNQASQYEIPCENNPQSPACGTAAALPGNPTAACRPLASYCVPFGQRLLTAAEKDGRIKWFRKCYRNNPDFLSALDTAQTMRTVSGVVCPGYPAMAVQGANGPVFVDAPVNELASCNLPINAFPAKFCTAPF